MKVVVAGATGKQGRGALWYLLKQKDVSQIVAAARRVDRVKELVARLGDERLMGWDLKTGKPLRSTLRRLGLHQEEKDMWG